MSVVIPVRDGAHVIGRCLEALADADAAGLGWEVIIADNGSKDETPSVIARFAGKLNLRIVSIPGVPVSAVRNVGAAHARGALLAFLDADCVVGRNWIRLAVGYPWEERSGAIGSFFNAGSGATWVARVWSRFEDSGKRGPVSLLPAGNMIVRRCVFEALTGFDETLESNEDAEFCRRLRARGLRIEAAAGLEAVHLGAPQTLRAFWRRELWHGKDVLVVFLRTGENARAVAFACYTLFSAVALLAAANWGVSSGDWWLVPASIAAMMAAPVALGVRSVRQTGQWRELVPLALLLAVYGVARAVALVRSANRVRHRDVARGATSERRSMVDSENRKPKHDVWASVVIPALNEERYIGQCLDSLSRLELPDGRTVEVIVVDNGSTDKTVEIAESFRHALNVRVIRKPGVPVSAARNFGASQASGEILAFLDADCVAPSGWLKNAAQQLANPGFGVVGAFYLLPPGSSWVAITWCRHVGRIPNGEVPYLGAHNLTLRRGVFQQVGGFDDALQTNEDYDLCQRVRGAGLKILACDAVSVVHLGTPQTLRGFFQRERWHGRHVVKVFLRDVRKLQNGKAVLFAVFTLFAVTTVLAGIVTAIRGDAAIEMWIPAMAWLASSLALSVRYTRRSRTWHGIPALAVLFLTWGLARASALLDVALPSAMLARKWNS